MYDWDEEVRKRKHRQPGIASRPAKFDEGDPSLAWLHKFASKHSTVPSAPDNLKDIYPWLWNPYVSLHFVEGNGAWDDQLFKGLA